jgi:hypothetical protein
VEWALGFFGVVVRQWYSGVVWSVVQCDGVVSGTWYVVQCGVVDSGTVVLFARQASAYTLYPPSCRHSLMVFREIELPYRRIDTSDLSPAFLVYSRHIGCDLCSAVQVVCLRLLLEMTHTQVGVTPALKNGGALVDNIQRTHDADGSKCPQSDDNKPEQVSSQAMFGVKTLSALEILRAYADYTIHSEPTNASH